MLRSLTETDLSEAVRFSECLLGKPESQSYPLFQSPAEIEAELRLRLCDANGGLIGCYARAQLCGVLCYFSIPAEQYLQTTAFLAAEGAEEVYSRFIAHLRRQHPGFTALIGLSDKNISAASALADAGFLLTEASADLRLTRAAFRPAALPFSALRRIGKKEFDSYAAFHDAHFGETYWNAARLRQEADAWYIFAYAPDGGIQGSIFMNVQNATAEIFGFAFETAEHAKRAALPLLSHALQTVLSENPAIESVVFFADENDAAILHAASACGFTAHSRYRLYESVL